MSELSHFDSNGNARMVDVSQKPVTTRTAVAEGQVRILRSTAQMISDGSAKKGDVFGTARLAGIMACKQTANLIPLCHPIGIDSVDVEIGLREQAEEFSEVIIRVTVKTTGNTGVEMEALTAVSATALTIYDMCKAVDRGMEIHDIRLITKTGGSSGDYEREKGV